MSTLEERREARRRRRQQQDENENDESLSGEAEKQLAGHRPMRASRLAQIAAGVDAISGEDEFERKRRERREARLQNHVGGAEEEPAETTSRRNRHRQEEETPAEDSISSYRPRRRRGIEEEETPQVEASSTTPEQEETPQVEASSTTPEQDEVSLAEREAERVRKLEEARARQRREEQEETERAAAEEERKEREAKEAEAAELRRQKAEKEAEQRSKREEEERKRREEEEHIREEELDDQESDDISEEDDEEEEEEEKADTTQLGSFDDATTILTEPASPKDSTTNSQSRIKQEPEMIKSSKDIWHEREIDSKERDEGNMEHSRSVVNKNLSLASVNEEGSGRLHSRVSMFESKTADADNKKQMHPELKPKFGDSHGPTRSLVGKIESKFLDNNNDMNKRDNNIAGAEKEINALNWRNTPRGSAPATDKSPPVIQSSIKSKVTSRWQHEQLTNLKTQNKTMAFSRQQSLESVTKLSSKWEHNEPKESTNYKKVPLENAVTVDSVSNLASKWQSYADESTSEKKSQSQRVLKKQRSTESVLLLATKLQQAEPTGKNTPSVQQRPLSASMTGTRQTDLSETPASLARPVEQTVLEGHKLSSFSQTKEEEERKRMEEEEVRTRDEDVTRKKKKKGKRKGLGGLSPEKKKMLKKLIMQKAAEDLRQEAKRKAEEKESYINERIEPLATEGLRDAELKKLCKQFHDKVAMLEEEVYDWEVRIRKQDFEINELTLKVNDTKGKFAKPVLRKVNKTESKFERLHRKEKQSDFRNQLKSTGQSKFTLEEEPKEPKTPDWKENLKKAEKEGDEPEGGGEGVAAEQS